MSAMNSLGTPQSPAPVPREMMGTRAALFRLWHDPAQDVGSTARKPTPELQARAAQGAKLSAPELWNPALQAPALQAPKPQASEPRAMVSGMVSAQFMPAMTALVGLGAAVTDVARQAAPPSPDAETLLARQRRLKEVLLDDLFIF